MICFPAILIFKLIKRFPIIVLALYCTQIFGSIEVEKEVEERTESVEFLENSLVSDCKSLNSDKEQTKNNDFTIAVFKETVPSITRGFIVSASHKLYILFSQLITDRWYCTQTTIQKAITLNHFITFKHSNHGNFKKSNRSEPTCHCSNILCVHNSNFTRNVPRLNKSVC